MKEDEIISSGHQKSECGEYVFRQWKIWDPKKPRVNVIAHHPKKIYDQPMVYAETAILNRINNRGFGGLYTTYINPFMPPIGDRLMHHVRKANNPEMRAMNEQVLEMTHNDCALVIVGVGSGFHGYCFAHEFLFRSDKLNYLGLGYQKTPISVSRWKKVMNPKPFDIMQWTLDHAGEVMA